MHTHMHTCTHTCMHTYTHTTHTHTHNTHTFTEPLDFSTLASSLRLQPEYRLCTGDRLTLRCNMPQGNPPPGPNIWLRNGVEVVESGTRVTLSNERTRLVIMMVEEGDAGIYQCLSAVDSRPATTIVQSGYLNVYCKLIPTCTILYNCVCCFCTVASVLLSRSFLLQISVT